MIRQKRPGLGHSDSEEQDAPERLVNLTALPRLRDEAGSGVFIVLGVFVVS